MSYLDDALARIQTGVRVTYDTLFEMWQIYEPPRGKSVYGLHHTRDAQEARAIYLLVCEIHQRPPKTLAEALLTMPAPIGGDDRLEAESEQTGLGVTPGWWRPDTDKEHWL